MRASALLRMVIEASRRRRDVELARRLLERSPLLVELRQDPRAAPLFAEVAARSAAIRAVLPKHA